jgi:arginase
MSTYVMKYDHGHADFAHPRDEPTGEAASMDLALATCRGPAVLSNLDGLCPLVRDDDVALLGYRVFDDGTDRHRGAHVRDTGILVWDLDDVRREGLGLALQASLARVARFDLAGFFVHVDADVLDDAVMPAVDYRSPGGLSFAELTHVLRSAISSGRAVGLELTIFNPALDADGSLARELVETLADGLDMHPAGG